VVAQIDPPMAAARGAPAHILAVVHASDYHVMDCPLSIHGVPHGLWPIGDTTKTALPASLKIMTSLNHSIHFHTHNGFRADELLYIEVTSPWAKDGRAMINSKIFSRQGMLIATVIQEVCEPVRLDTLLTAWTGILCLQRECQALKSAWEGSRKTKQKFSDVTWNSDCHNI
jgi:hypothetical protein